MKVYGGVMATLNVEPHHIIQGCRERAGACETIPGDPAQLGGAVLRWPPEALSIDPPSSASGLPS